MTNQTIRAIDIATSFSRAHANFDEHLNSEQIWILCLKSIRIVIEQQKQNRIEIKKNNTTNKTLKREMSFFQTKIKEKSRKKGTLNSFNGEIDDNSTTRLQRLH